MSTDPSPSEEAQRLASLQSYEILDTPPEPAFERVTAMVTRLFGVPVAVVALFDANRQWFKSVRGLDLHQVPNAIAFCHQANSSDDELLVIADALQDARFVNNPLVAGALGVRFYAGAPLCSSQGYRLGSLCLVDFQPRDFDEAARQLLREFAALTVDELDLRREARLRRQAEAEQSRDHERLRLLESVVVNSNDAVLITEAEPVNDPGPRIIYVNAAFERMSGYTEAEVLGRNPRLLQGPNTDPAARATLRHALERWKPVCQELVNYHKDGKEFWAELSIVPVADETGRFTHWVSVQRDVTARKRTEAALRASEARYGRIAANVPGMVYQFVLHPDGSHALPFVSEGCREIFGLEPAQIQADARRFLAMIFPEDRPSFEHLVAESARNLAPWEWQGRFTMPSTGEIRCVQAASRPELQGNGDIVWDGVLMDVTERERAAENQRAKAEAERANAAKSEFLSRMSHELRTPLNAILGFGQLLEMDGLGHPHQESVDHILRAGRHLLGLVNEVLSLTNIEGGRVEMSLEAVGLAELVGETLGLVRPLATERGIRLELGQSLRRDLTGKLGPHVLADRQRLRQVLLNLFSNAIKYNVVGGLVNVDYVMVSSGRVRLRVADTGPGIPWLKRAHLFTPFERLGAEASGVEGMGLGLAVSFRLMEAMGGSLGLESEVDPSDPPVGDHPGPGAVFWLELPRANPAVAARDGGTVPSPGMSASAPVPSAGTVLLVEDNLSNLRLVERLMGAYPGVQLLSAMQGTLGLDLARQHRPDLILLDLHLPDLSGVEVLARLRADEDTRGIPVVIVSADATEAQGERLMQRGARAYLTKPFDLKELLRLMRELMPGLGG